MNERGLKFIEGALFSFNALGSSVGFFAMAYYAYTQNEVLPLALFAIAGTAAFTWPFYRRRQLTKKKPVRASVSNGVDLKAVMQALRASSLQTVEESEALKMEKPCKGCGHGAEHHEDIACRKCDCGEYL